MDSLTPMIQMGVLGSRPARGIPVLPDSPKTTASQGSSAEEEAAAIASKAFASLASRNEKEFFSVVDDAAVFEDLMFPAPAAEIGARAWLDAWSGPVSGMTCEIATIFAAGEDVLVEMVVRGTLNGTLGPVEAARMPFAVHRAAVVRVERGRVVRASLFGNGKELAEAVGQWPLRDRTKPS